MESDFLHNLLPKLRNLTPNQLRIIDSIQHVFGLPNEFQRLDHSDIVSDEFLESFGDSLRIHHAMSTESFTKDKFEYAMDQIMRQLGRKSELSVRGNRGHDITIEGDRWSLKTQADRNIRVETLHVSKFMELGQGTWENEVDLYGLKDQFIRHMESYERIFSLRQLSNSAKHVDPSVYRYELVEIPKPLLMRAIDRPCEMKHDSTQTPKPGTCSAYDQDTLLFELYFDGGSERKLQIRKLNKAYCTVHATWTFSVG